MTDLSIHAATQLADDELIRAAAAHQVNERRSLVAGDLDAAREHAAQRFLCLTILGNRTIGDGDGRR